MAKAQRTRVLELPEARSEDFDLLFQLLRQIDFDKSTIVLKPGKRTTELRAEIRRQINRRAGASRRARG